MTFRQRRFNVVATSWRLYDVDATSWRLYKFALTSMQRHGAYAVFLQLILHS